MSKYSSPKTEVLKLSLLPSGKIRVRNKDKTTDIVEPAGDGTVARMIAENRGPIFFEATKHRNKITFLGRVASRSW